MQPMLGNRPAEIFGYPIWNGSEEAQDIRNRNWCPFQDKLCNKKSRLIDYPFGVCSVEHNGRLYTICPHRFGERATDDRVPKIIEDIARHYFGDLNNLVGFPEVRLPNVGSIDYILIRHKPLEPKVDDFVSIEFQSDSTTSTGRLVEGINDFFDKRDLREKSYNFGLNTYDSIKRAITQLMNKGIVYETWDTKCYWVIQEYIYENLVNRYGFKSTGYSPEHASRFALCNLVPENERLTLNLIGFVSTTVDEVYQAMRNKPNLPGKDDFVKRLNAKLRLELNLRQ